MTLRWNATISLIGTRDGGRMTDCDDLIDRFHAQARAHVHLAVIAEAAPVAEMHVDMALFSEERARAFEELCDDG